MSVLSDKKLLLADVVYNGLGTPQQQAAVLVEQHGDNAQIIAFDSAVSLQKDYPNVPHEYVGYALTPAPVNAHTHLDLSTMPLASGRYEDFISHVIAHSKKGQRGLNAAKQGIKEIKQAGVNVVGDIVTDETVMRHLLQSPDLTGVAYWEVLGPDPKDADRIFNETITKLRQFKQLESASGVRVGVSPHTPHTVSAPLLTKLAGLAKQNNLPMQIHVAESAGEVAFHHSGEGPISDMMRGFIPEWQPSGLTPVGYLASLGVLDAQPTLVHMVHVTEADVKLVQQSGCVVVHCPRSNAELNCGMFPWQLFERYSVTVGFGTDSRGSSPSLNVKDEVRYAREHLTPKPADASLVWSAVKGGYRALGLKPPQVLRGADLSALHVWK